ncbi:MAG: ATP-binding protein [Anaerolineales bacterium]|nr:ATP-binding protein [Anaerolineales bacterium]MCB8954102.1 ATP-binding protein [Ardenticatenales bacterium]
MSMHPEIAQEKISVEGGLGPFKEEIPLELHIKPLTVFIGPQGTGKSLLSQLLYFFRDAQYLLSNHFSQESPDATVRKVVEGIRAGELTNRALASFLTTPKVRVHYSSERGDQKEIAFYRSNRQINPLSPFKNDVAAWLQQVIDDPSVSGRLFAKALFVPAERTFYSRFINVRPALLGESALPITMREFSKTLSRAADTHQMWQRERGIPPEVQQINDIVAAELGGRATIATRGRFARQWQWLPENSQQPLEIEMASSGQMGTWPLVSTIQALLGWPASQRPQYIHIEEPETHLHPAAQVAIVKMLAFLVNRGFKLVITTHSLELLYAINNLILAYQRLGESELQNGFPSSQVRLNPENVIAYLFTDGTAYPVMTESSQIDEGVLGRVLGNLEIEFNHLMAHGILWE